MDKHPISDLMAETMSKIREMVDANTIIGNPVTTPDGIMIIPVSRVSFGFGSGGLDFAGKNPKPIEGSAFSGGGGAGVNITPIAFLVINNGNVKLIPVSPPANTTVDRVVEMVPDIIDKVDAFISKKKAEKEE